MLYDIAFAIFAIFYIPTLLFKGKLHGDFTERFGVFSRQKAAALKGSRGAIWIQAVSVGEVMLCKNLIPELRKAYPARPIVLSTITRTGNDIARKLFSHEAVIIYFPLDLSGIVKDVVGVVRPSLYIMIETEIWPNILREMSRQRIPVILINGRISDRSIGKYRLAARFLKGPLAKVSLFCMQSDLDADRIISIGAPKEKVRVTGNMKYDAGDKIDMDMKEEFAKYLNLVPYDDLVVAGSTHKPEEKAILEAYARLTENFPNLRLMIAPRHIERADEIEKMVTGMGFESSRFSKWDKESSAFSHSRHVFILDKMGYLNAAYSASLFVFIGGSLVNHGGQNLIEPALLGKAIVFGPYMFNFRSITKTFIENNAAIQISGGKDLVNSFSELLSDKNKCAKLGENAKAIVASGRGAVSKNLEAIKKVFNG